MFLGFNREGGFGLFQEGPQMNFGKNKRNKGSTQGREKSFGKNERD